MENERIAIEVKNLHKTFRLPHEKRSTIKSAFIGLFRRQSYETQHVLKDISMEIKEGEFFGIVGKNGSGKSTLLKILAGIYYPSKGKVKVNGKLTPFIELGVGFSPELSGRENVYLNGSLLGFNRKEMDEMYDDIVRFAELENFMDQKLKNYSSGMQVRLAFSIAIKAKSDILLLDEVLAVGDNNFQQKCYEYFAKIKRMKKTVIFVSHDMNAVRNFCTRAALVNDSKLEMIGKPADVIRRYTELNFQRLENNKEDEESSESLKRWGNGHATIKKVWSSCKGKKTTTFKPKDKIEIKIDIKSKEVLENPVIGMVLHDNQDRVVFATNTNELDIDLPKIKANQAFSASFLIDNIFNDGSYRVSCAIASKDRSVIFSRVEDALTINLHGFNMTESITHPTHSFKLIND